ncbi:hypothetical protein BST96_08095 [Oceanicoccus sagamiensis]|uniref:Polysaccharide biosynthesis protein C-terminal domain-containing protein n=1 Tax=Oceanicoccus sagamiensis TaxID=716816 RepID=A0A1X9NDW9_9GAMM|nr:oligosaccharide flippase family protein [Oceanicoccus sagamiensis]ARN74085.1 hypothetical protein BST96_08095 [Oceanicoccus sagamiensis]
MLVPEQLSLIAIYGLFGQLALVMFGFGVVPFIIRQVPEMIHHNPDHIGAHTRKCYIIAVFAGLAFGLTLYFSLNYIPAFETLKTISDTSWAFLIIGLAAQSLNNVQLALLSALKKFKAVAAVTMFMATSTPIIILILFYFFDSDGILMGLSVASMLLCGFSRYMLSTNIDIDISVHKGIETAILKTSWPFYMEGFVMFFRRQGDQVVVAFILGDAALGIYFFAKRMVEMMANIISAADRVISTTLSHRFMTMKEKIAGDFANLMKLAVYFSPLLAIVAAILVPLYIEIISGDKYIAALIPGIILCFRVITDVTRGIVIGRMIFVVCEPSVRLKLTTFEVLIALPAMFIGGYTYGLVGIAFAPIISGVISGIYGVFILRKRLNITFPVYDVLLGFMCMFMSLAVVYYFSTYTQSMYLNTILCMLFGGMTYLVMMTNLVNKKEVSTLLKNIVPEKLHVIIHWLFKLRFVRA